MELGLEIQNTNLRIRINILEMLCVSIFKQKRENFDFFIPNIFKNELRVGNSEN